ncbi:TetR/AcrR family transcriptional regulator [Minwuia sp.]|uniref:TetR/AcrR family transcriptional regulator n=1 Tax=Minwuia sp. TaxID=2493630 RepID=UPI003A956D81
MNVNEKVQDKRKLRSVRTRNAIIEALAALQSEGNPKPSAEQIAERAKTSRRTIFQHFSDREELTAATFEHLLENVLPPQSRDTAATGDLTSRLDEFLDFRIPLLDAIAPHRRAANLILSSSTAIAGRRSALRKKMRDDLSNWFMPEVESWPDDCRNARLNALATLTDWEVWDSLRHQWGHDAKDARSILKRLLFAALWPMDSHGGQQNSEEPSGS